MRLVLAERVARDCDVIIGHWIDRARREQPDAEGSHRSDVLDRLPDLVRAVGTALLEPHAPRSANRAHALGAEHGLQRWVAGWRLEEVIRDYQILRHVLIEHLEHAAGRAIPASLTCEIGELLDRAVTGAALAFVHYQEEHLRESEQRGRQIINASLDAVISIDSLSRILEWNPQAEQIFGWTREEVLGRNLADFLIPGRFRERHLTALQKFLATGDGSFLNRRVEITSMRRDGAEFPVELSIVPVRIGEAYLFSAFVRDITERKQAAEDLRETKEAAEQANRAKSEFLANISHELRTPMNAIMGMTELALDEALDERVRDYLQTAHESADLLLRLLNEILDFSRLESGRFVLESAPFSLRATMEETVRTLSLHASEKGLELALDLPDNTPDDLIGDALRLRQILMNLIGNAIKFTEQGEVIVRAGVESLTADEASLLFSVSDTGIGITSDDQERIFTPFTQADASTTRHYGGTGLGLAISTQLIGLMGGRLWVESALGDGSTFSFRVRFLRQKPRPSESEQQARFEQLRDVPVLIVDDNASNRRILQTILSNWSMKPEMASDGASALEKIEEAARSGRQYGIIILDALMPGMDGFTLAERIKSEPQGSGTTILMLSSADRQTFARRCEQLDIAEYLEKPISHSDLLNSLCRVLGLTHEESAAHDQGRTLPGPSHRSLRVLLAEDVRANQKLIVSILSRRGHVVEIARNGREAVDLAKRSAFDVILMDVQMPIMDGFQATAILRSLTPSETARVPIVAMTAHAMRGDRERCLAAGMDAYISKPIDSRRLVELIESVAQPESNPLQ